MDYSEYTKKELVDMINKLEGPEVTTRARKDTLIEILMERMKPEPVIIEPVMPTTKSKTPFIIAAVLAVIVVFILAT